MPGTIEARDSATTWLPREMPELTEREVVGWVRVGTRDVYSSNEPYTLSAQLLRAREAAGEASARRAYVVVEGAWHSSGIIAGVSAETMQLAREGLEAWRRGDFEAVKSMLEPSATWRWFEPGEWDCENRDDIMRTLRERHAQGFANGDLEFIDRGSERVIVVSYPSRIGGEEWPDETATVLSFRNGKVVDMQDYRTRDDAIAATD